MCTTPLPGVGGAFHIDGHGNVTLESPIMVALCQELL